MNIKVKIYWLATLFAVTGVFSACTTNNDANEENLVSDKYLIVDTKKQVTANSTLTVVELVSNCKWKVDYTTNVEWPGLNIDPMSGEGNANIRVTVNANETDADRAVVLNFIAEDEQLNKTCEIIQTVGDFEGKLILAGSDEVTVDYEGKPKDNQSGSYTDAYTVIIEECNTSWTAEVLTDDDGTWCELLDNRGQKKGSFGVKFSENQTDRDRKAVVTVMTTNSAGTQAYDGIIFTQEGAPKPFALVDSVKKDKDGVAITIYGTVKSRSKYELTEYGYIITSEKNKDYTNFSKKVSSGDSQTEATFTEVIKLEDGYDYVIKSYAKTRVGISESDPYPISLDGDEPNNNDNPWQPLARKVNM